MPPPNACRPPADFPTLSEWGDRGVAPRQPAQRRGRAAAVTACPTARPPPSHNSSCYDCIGQTSAEAAAASVLLCGGGGKRRQSLARPFARSLLFTWGLASPHLWPVGTTDGGKTEDAPRVYKQGRLQRRLGHRQEVVPLPGKPRANSPALSALSNSDRG